MLEEVLLLDASGRRVLPLLVSGLEGLRLVELLGVVELADSVVESFLAGD